MEAYFCGEPEEPLRIAASFCFCSCCCQTEAEMSSVLAVFFCSFWILTLVTDASPTVSPGPDHHQLSSSDCVSCSLTQVTKNSSAVGGQSDMVEAVKRHILNMLHLSARPNLTQTLPRSALLNAIKKLHVGRVAEDGSVEMPEDPEGPGALAPPEPASEIITFGYPGESSPARAPLHQSSAPLELSCPQVLVSCEGPGRSHWKVGRVGWTHHSDTGTVGIQSLSVVQS